MPPISAEQWARHDGGESSWASLGWPNLFGPFHNSTSPETDLLTTWPDSGPPEKWRQSIGAGYSAPVVHGDRLILLQRKANQEIVDCLDAETGNRRWSYAYLRNEDTLLCLNLRKTTGSQK